jgi:hypothetical protein
MSTNDLIQMSRRVAIRVIDRYLGVDGTKIRFKPDNNSFRLTKVGSRLRKYVETFSRLSCEWLKKSPESEILGFIDSETIYDSVIFQVNLVVYSTTVLYFKIIFHNGRAMAKDDLDTTDFVHTKDEDAIFFSVAQLKAAEKNFARQFKVNGLRMPQYTVVAYDHEDEPVSWYRHS